MKRMLKLISALIVSCILFGVFAVNAFADNIGGISGNDDISGKWEVGASTGVVLSVNDLKTEAVLTIENGDNFAPSITMIIAAYNGSGKLIGAALKTEAGDLSNTFNMTLPAGTGSVKAFILDSETGVPAAEQMALEIA